MCQCHQRNLRRVLHTVALISVLTLIATIYVLRDFYNTHHRGDDNNSKPQKYSPINKLPNGSLYVSFSQFQDGRRLGNQMFTLSVAIYVAKLTGREVVLRRNHSAKDLDEIFEINLRRYDELCPCYRWNETLVSYDERIETLVQKASNFSETILLNGYFQSWKYLRSTEHRVREMFTFKKKYKSFADDFLRKSIPPGWKEFIRVGVHNRRGDYLWEGMNDFGYTTANETYFQKSMKYFTDRYTRVLFIVASEDNTWTADHILKNSSSENVTVVIFSDSSAGNAMAVLSMCDHVILSTGSFGWWAAWLANGTSIYYEDFPRKNSPLYRMQKPSDYYPPTWISMI